MKSQQGTSSFPSSLPLKLHSPQPLFPQQTSNLKRWMIVCSGASSKFPQQHILVPGFPSANGLLNFFSHTFHSFTIAFTIALTFLSLRSPPLLPFSKTLLPLILPASHSLCRVLFFNLLALSLFLSFSLCITNSHHSSFFFIFQPPNP